MSYKNGALVNNFIDIERPLLPEPQGGEAAMPVRQALRVLRRHLPLFFSTAFLVAAAGAGLVLTLKATYTATATVAISTSGADPLTAGGGGAGDRIEDDRPATEAARLQSRDVAEAVVRQFPPVQHPPGFDLRTFACHLGLSLACRPPAPPQTPEQRLQGEIDGFLSSLLVVPATHSRVLDVSVTADDGARAALLANAVVTNYQRIALAEQTGEVNSVAGWLDSRTNQLRQRWLDAVRRADTFNATKGLTNTGDGTGANPLVDRQIVETAVSLSQAQARLAAAQARADALGDAARHGSARGLVALGQQPILVATANQLMQLQSTRNQEAAQLGPNHPQIRALDGQIAAMRASLGSETGAALASIREDLVSARAEVKQLSANLDLLRGQAGTQSTPQAEYRSLAQEAQSARTVYETFLERSTAVVDRAALLQPPVAFISHATAPSRPTFPNHLKLALGVLVAALVAAAAAVLARETLSLGFGEVSSLRLASQLPMLAAIPLAAARSSAAMMRHVLDYPLSPTTEAIRSIAAQLSLLAADVDSPHAVLITSAGSGEGKSTLSAWLALTVRKGGQNVLLIDSDYRRGSLMQHMSNRTQLGLTELLAGRATPADVIRTDPETGLDFIGSGAPMGHPFGRSDIIRLRSLIATLKRSYSLIVIDSPPLLAMSDGLVYASIVDQTVFVYRWQHTSRRAVTACLERLRAYGARIPGVVVSMVNQRSALTLGEDYSRREIQLLSRTYES